MERYDDRVDAGRRLGKLVAARIDAPAVVLAVPRAGVLVGAQVATALHAPLVPLLVRKVGLPENPGLVVGAIDADGSIVSAKRTTELGLLPAEMEGLGEDVSSRLNAWRRAFGAPDPAEVLPGHVAVIVDDALVTGLTVRAGVAYLRRRAASRIVVAVPCGRADAIEVLEQLGVEVVAPVRLAPGGSPADVYRRLPEVSEEEVASLLARGGPSRKGKAREVLAADRELRLVDDQACPHPARFRLPEGLGPAPAVLLLGPGAAPGDERGEAAAARLAEAGIASLRTTLGDGAPPERLIALALDVLSARPEVDALRLGVVAAGEVASGAAAVAAQDRRVGAVVVLARPDGLDLPSPSLVVDAQALEVRDVDRITRWVADRLRPRA